MNMNRRDAIKLGAISVAAVAVSTVANAAPAAAPVAVAAPACEKRVLAKHQIVVIGGGFGGLTVAKGLKKKDSKLDVLVIEKNDTFMSCPFSNSYLGKLEGLNLGTFVFDYAQPVSAHGYGMLKSEVIGINREAKEVHTAAGIVEYDILVLAPGIDYDYENQFPTFSKEKIADLQRNAPGALIPGSEHVALDRMLKGMDDGDVVITVPKGKFRCPPAPFERASMIAAFMKKEDISGKVIILNPTAEIAKGAAFKEAWKELYGDNVVHMDFCTIDDVDTAGKTISFTQKISTGKKDADGFDIMKEEKKSHKYAVLNLIPNNKSNSVIKMSGVETTSDSFGKVLMNGCSFQTKTDKNVYAVGDVVGHGIPPSGQTAVWAGHQCVEEIIHQLQGKTYELPVKTTTVNAGNVCYSMVGDKPEEAIMVTHDFSWTGTVINGKGNVPKGPDGKFRSTATAKATRDWYRGIMADLFS
ncbi:MAG: FAD-dependent oxidoreductase [Sulfurimonas sp.]|nr:FAD-dependent oxidoreductase [Sulfurimonas sp.]